MKTKLLALEAMKNYIASINLFDEAMNDGINVQGALAGRIGATDMADEAIAALEADIAQPAPDLLIERDQLKALNAELAAALEFMWDSSCTNAASRPSKAAFLAARAALDKAKKEAA